MSIDLAYDIYPRDAPRNGTILTRLTAGDFLLGTEPRKVLRGVGSGKIVIHRSHPAVEAGYLAHGNYVRVRKLTDESVVHGFFLNDGNERVLSVDEKGREIREYGGMGTLSYLARATFGKTLRSDVDESLAQHQEFVDANGYLRFGGPETYGGVLGRLIYEARLDVPDAVPELQAHTWDDVEDSGGTPWTEFDDYYDVRVGDNLLDLAIDLMRKGIDLFLDPHTFVPRAYLAGTYGTDRTSGTFAAGKVRFVAGVNIAADVERALPMVPSATHVTVIGQDGVTQLTVADPDWSDGEAVYKDTIRLDTTVDPTIMEEAGYESIRLRKLHSDGVMLPHIWGDDEAAGLYLPTEHYDVGDLVTLHTGDEANDFTEQSIQVAAIRWRMRQAGDFEPVAELGAQYIDQRSAAQINSLTTIIRNGSHVHPPNPRLCVPGIPAIPPTVLAHWPFDDDLLDDTDTYSVSGPTLSGSGYATSGALATGDVNNDAPYLPIPNGATITVAAALTNHSTEPGRDLNLNWRLYPGSGGGTAVAEGTAAGSIAPNSSGTLTVTITNSSGATAYLRWSTFKNAYGAGNHQSIHDVLVTQGSGTPAVPNDGHPALVGTETGAKRCDDTEHWHEDGYPTTEHNADAGFRPHTLWIHELTGEMFYLKDADAGTWIQITTPSSTPGGSGGLPWYDVTAYGALGDGTTNDTSAINDAIAALNAAGAGVLYFPAGTYLCSSALTTITARGIILGDGPAGFDGGTGATVVTQTSDTANLFTITGYRVTFRDIALQNTEGSPTAGAGISVSGATGAEWVSFENISVSNFYDNVSMDGCTSWRMSGSYIHNPVRYGIRIRNTPLPDAGDWAITDGTHIYAGSRNGTAAIQVESSGGGRITDVKINATPAGGRFVDGIRFALATGLNTSILVIADVSIENVSGDAIDIATVGTATFSQVMIDNVQVGLYTNNAGRAVKVTAAAAGGFASPGGITGVAIEGLMALTDGTARAAVELTNVDVVTLGERTLLSNFTSLYTGSGNTNVSDSASGGGASAFDDLTDVTITSIAAGDEPRWDGSAWVNTGPLICVDPGSITVDPGPPFGVTLATDWGVDAGQPYYDDAGAAAGDEAALFYDPLTGGYCLVTYDF